MSVHRTVSLTGLNSNEIYSLRYPDSLLKFCAFDFSNFIRRCTDFCKRCEANGEYRLEDAVALRNSISACHKFFEANLHGIFEKIIPDFFIEYICRERGVGTATLWNSLISAQNRFEKTIFSRLTEYRHNKAVNQWVNLLQMQEYAKRKLDFIFGEKSDLALAAAKRDYFDLTFSVAANELGYPMGCFSSAGVYSVGRLPASPFIVGTVAKEIAKTALSELEYGEDDKTAFNPMRSDTEAMDIFARIKNLLPEKPDTVINTIIKTMRSMPKKVYVSESFKAVIDLEIDLLIESGAVLQRCERCGEYFLRDKDYDYDYCSRPQQGGKTCFEISTTVPPRTQAEIEELEAMTSELYTYMSKRINVDLTQRDFAEWYQYFMAIKENISHRNLSIAEFRDFEKYSKELRFAPVLTPAPSPAPTAAKPAETVQTDKKPEVRPFVFERIDRSELYEQEKKRLRRAKKEQELQEAQTAAEADNSAEAVRPTVKVMKAEQAQNVDVSLFENPFDGAFDSHISELETVNSHDFKPLDDIFSFDSTAEAKPTPASEDNKQSESEPDSFNPDSKEELSSGFEKEIAKASYIRESNTTRRGYAAGMYKKTAETTGITEDGAETAADNVLFADIQSDGADRITENDFDILPSSFGGERRAPEAPAKKLNITDAKPAQSTSRRRSSSKTAKTEPPKITLGESKQTTNKTKRVLDGILNPVKNHNPFINDD